MKKDMHQSQDNKFIPMTSISSGKGREIKKDVYYYTNQIVNIIMIGDPKEGDWVLVDAGMPKSGSEIISVIQDRFGRDNKPSAIVLTHGHFDHVGGLMELIEEWDVPVYAHPLEFPYLTGKKEYPEPDPSVEGGLLAKISFIYPTHPIDIKSNLYPLPTDHSVPHMPGWVWIPSAGHSPGHASFYRGDDRILISGDAFITVRQDSLYKVLLQREEINGPPRYLTTNWQAAWESVKNLELLQPLLAIPGHGNAMEGKELRQGLKKLVQEFDKVAIPDHGKYVDGR
ncbi:MAG: MBL fold metallo-hydrolase [Anditalea sp.]